MATINLVKQIRQRMNAGTQQAEVPSDKNNLARGIVSRLSDLASGGGGSLERGEKIRLVLVLLGIASIFVSRSILSQHLGQQEDEKKAEIASISAEIQVQTQKLASFAGIKAEIDSYEAKMNDLREKLTLIESVRKNRNSVVRMIDFVVTETPTAIWFTKLNVDYAQGDSLSATGQKISIAGYAMTLQVVSEFMKKLEGAVFFPHWELSSTENESLSPGSGGTANLKPAKNNQIPIDAKKFEISARIVTP